MQSPAESSAGAKVIELRPRASRASSELARGVTRAVERARDYFLRAQHPAGYWHAPLEANVTMGAQYVFFNRFLGRERPLEEGRILEYVRDTQQADGSWPLFEGGPGHLSTTVEAYAAMRMAGYPPNDAVLEAARRFIRERGGLERAGVFTKIFLAYFGEVPWSAVPTLPAELMFVRPWMGFSIYEMSSWARGTVVPLLVLMARKPRITVPGFTVAELYRDQSAAGRLRFAKPHPFLSIDTAFLGVDRALKAWSRVPQPFRGTAIRAACDWILRHQDTNGGWGGIQPPMINGPMALATAGFAVDHPAIVRGVGAVDAFLMEIPDGNLVYQPCESPVWDTALAAKALLDSGLPADHPSLVRAASWLVDQQILEPGDWSIKNPHLEPGGWAFEFANDWYPDVDDSAVILMVLRRIRHPDGERLTRAIKRGLDWTLGMQSKNGGWAAFDTDNTLDLLNRIPFADMEAMIDPPTADVTGRILELMGSFRFDSSDRRVARALAFVRRLQEPSGAWWGRWGVNYVYGTWSVLAGLRAIGEDRRSATVRRGVEWLKSCQNPDGGWGEDCGSYDDPSLAGSGDSTPSQTAWAILGLLAGDDELGPEVTNGIEWLLRHQAPVGNWNETAFTGTGFPRHFYLRYWMYSDYFPLMALGQFERRLAERS
ncbi:MAG: squalene-hopene/tetraprenyl-beta-curcumene cyclase [Candidatus Binatota bacterium]|nr:squalene-hopene/tetraprenyl-beta-curcumene cyclase [Candidatus Binatota bacterium]